MLRVLALKCYTAEYVTWPLLLSIVSLQFLDAARAVEPHLIPAVLAVAALVVNVMSTVPSQGPTITRPVPVGDVYAEG